nr:hypothetical protein HK105_000523 [Polyrhizophydium stewartii]
MPEGLARQASQASDQPDADADAAPPKRTLWDSFSMYNPSMTLYPSLELFSEAIIEHKLKIETGDEVTIRLLLIHRPIMDEDLEHHTWTGLSGPFSANNAAWQLASEGMLPEELHPGVLQESASDPAKDASAVKSAWTPSAASTAGSTGQPAARPPATLFSLPSQMLDTINPFNAIPSLFAKADVPLPDLAIRSLENDAQLAVFMALVRDPRGSIIVAQVQRFAADLAAHFALNPTVSVAAKTATDKASERSDALAKRILDFLDAMLSFLNSIRFVRTQGEPYVMSVLAGMETYLLGRFHDNVFGILLMEEQRNDHILASRLSVLGISSFGLGDLGLGWLQHHKELWKTVRLGGLELMRFERDITPARKLDALLRLHAHLVEFLEAVNKERDDQSDSHKSGISGGDGTGTNADTLLGLLIYVVVETHPTHLFSSLRFVQKFRNPVHLDGQASYSLVNLDAATRTTIMLPIDETKILDSRSTRPPSPLRAALSFQPSTALLSGITAVSDDMCVVVC